MDDIEDDEEIEEILRRKKEVLIRKISQDNNRSEGKNYLETVYSFLTDTARRYLREKISNTSREKILTALYFLISKGLVEKPLDLDPVVYISRRVLGADYKIFIEDEGEIKEL